MSKPGETLAVHLVETEERLHSACAVLTQLRVKLSPEKLLVQVREQLKDGYRLACVEQEGRVICVAGFVIGTKLAWGRHLYVDDLVTDENSRSTGAGSLLLHWLKGFARRNGCTQLHLDSGVQRYDAHRFYLRHGFHITSHHFAITDLNE